MRAVDENRRNARETCVPTKERLTTEELGERRREVKLKARKSYVPAKELTPEELGERRRGAREWDRARELAKRPKRAAA
jgi:hypothetical protein